jgi:hypothetical protein
MNSVMGVTLYLYEAVCTSAVWLMLDFTSAQGQELPFLGTPKVKKVFRIKSRALEVSRAARPWRPACARAANGSSIAMPARLIRANHINHFANEATAMSKGLNQKKDTKKKPAKSLKEKRAEKEAKRQSRG